MSCWPHFGWAVVVPATSLPFFTISAPLPIAAELTRPVAGAVLRMAAWVPAQHARAHHPQAWPPPRGLKGLPCAGLYV